MDPTQNEMKQGRSMTAKTVFGYEPQVRFSNNHNQWVEFLTL
jgi:hypothetical protein